MFLKTFNLLQILILLSRLDVLRCNYTNPVDDDQNDDDLNKSDLMEYLDSMRIEMSRRYGSELVQRRFLSSFQPKPVASNMNFVLISPDNDKIARKYMRLMDDGTLHDNKYNYISKDIFKKLDPSIPTYIVIHGWLGNLVSPNFAEILNRIAKYGYGNSIGVQWTRISFTSYSKVVKILPDIAKHVVTFIDLLAKETGITPSNITIIGHSLGAQIAGFVGQNIKNGKLKRIDGLDPAGPFFSGLSKDFRLSPDDAEFVSVIHSDINMYGINEKIGHVDFYPNGGYGQPGCTPKIDLTFGCSHCKAILLYCQSITEELKSAKCESYEKFTKQECPETNDFMGFKAVPTLRGTYYNQINKSCNFCSKC